MALEVQPIPALNDNYIWFLHDPEANVTAVVDPGEATPALMVLRKRNLKLDYILTTHHHHDHTEGNLELKDATGCTILGSEADRDRVPGLDRGYHDGDTFAFGDDTVEVMFVPGHTMGHIAFYFRKAQALFCGDTLFSLGCGRLFEGTAEEMWSSLSRFAALPPQTKVYCAHEYTQANGKFALAIEPENPALQRRLEEVKKKREEGRPTLPSTIALEKETNPFLRAGAPTVQRAVAMEGAPAVKVFAELRLRKNTY